MTAVTLPRLIPGVSLPKLSFMSGRRKALRRSLLLTRQETILWKEFYLSRASSCLGYQQTNLSLDRSSVILISRAAITNADADYFLASSRSARHAIAFAARAQRSGRT